MIPRYTRPEMAAIWDPQTRFRIWFEIEAHAADAMAELGMIPKAAAAQIWKIDVATHASCTDPRGVVLCLSRVARRDG